MSSSIFINQQAFLPVSDYVAPEANMRDPQRQRNGKNSHKTYMKKLKKGILTDNQKALMTLKEFIDYFQQDMNDPASTLIAIEETMRIIKEEHNTEINISIGTI